MNKIELKKKQLQKRELKITSVYVEQSTVQQNMHVIHRDFDMEIGFITGTILIIIMVGMAYVGIHINKPFPWEKEYRKTFDKSDIEYRDGDNT